MASTPNFGSTPRCGTLKLSSSDGTAAVDFTNFTPPAAGTRVKEIRVHSGPSAAPGGTFIVCIFVHNGTDSFIIDRFQLINAVDTRQAVLRYDSLILPQGYKLQAAVRTTLAALAALNFVAEGEDLT